MLFTWWEKTVEYAFILRALDESEGEFDFAAPLAGAHETGGDSIFAKGARLLLIEFKRNEDALASEEDKYENYKAAEASMSGRDGHHLIVYGECAVEKEGKAKLIVAAKTYFARDDVAVDFNQGVAKAAFDEYLAELLVFKKKDGRSSGRLGVEAFASVIGLTPNGELINASLSEYMEHGMPYEQSNQLSPPTSTPQTPSFDM